MCIGCVCACYQQVGASLGVAILAVALGCTVSVDRILMTAGGAPLVIIGAATALTFLYPRPNKVCLPLGIALCPAVLSPLCPLILSSPVLFRHSHPLPSCQTLLLFTHVLCPFVAATTVGELTGGLRCHLGGHGWRVHRVPLGSQPRVRLHRGQHFGERRARVHAVPWGGGWLSDQSPLSLPHSLEIRKCCCFPYTTSLLLQLPSAYELLLAVPRLLLGFGVLFLTRAVVKVVGGAVSERVLTLLGHPPASTPRSQR
jgi:hypothetical protein